MFKRVIQRNLNFIIYQGNLKFSIFQGSNKKKYRCTLKLKKEKQQNAKFPSSHQYAFLQITRSAYARKLVIFFISTRQEV
jgi:hypothetical protein